MDSVANFTDNTTVKVCQSYEQVYSATVFFWLTVYMGHKNKTKLAKSVYLH